MSTKKFFLSLALVLGCFFVAYSQSTYKSAIGARLGYPLAVSYKQFISDQGAIEAFAGYRGYVGYGWFNAGVTYQHHFPIGSIEGFQWYVGGGASVYFWNYDFAGDYASTTFGILAVGGVDYKFANIPLNVSADYMPAFFIGNGYYTGFGGAFGGLSARYTFK